MHCKKKKKKCVQGIKTCTRSMNVRSTVRNSLKLALGQQALLTDELRTDFYYQLKITLIK